MKIASWNVNSVRVRIPQLQAVLARLEPDVLCLQETKCQDDQFPRQPLAEAGYSAEVFGQKTYNGVAILTRNGTDVQDVIRGLDDDADDAQARVIGATVNGVRVYSIYAPNGQVVGAPAYDYKLTWYERLVRLLQDRHRPTEPLAVCGDFNVAPEDRDVYDPVAWAGSVLVSQPERAALSALCAYGLVDTFRQLHEEDGRYSWWDYRQLAFPRNQGLRIDHVLASRPLAARLQAADIDREARKGKQPSDHAPVWAAFADTP